MESIGCRPVNAGIEVGDGLADIVQRSVTSWGCDAGVASLQTWLIEHALQAGRSVQRRGVGAWLLQDAMLRALSASEEFGVRVLLVHAIDEQARAFYEPFGFEVSPTDPLNLQLLIKDIPKTLGAGSA